MDSVGELTVAEPAVSQATDRAAWLNERKKGIGGSDVAAILGLSKWSTPYQVYADKRGESEERAQSMDMLIGTVLEPWILEEYERQTESQVERVGKIIYDKEYPFLLANVDGMRPDRIVECKKARDNKDWGDAGTDQVPTGYLLQCNHYMRVCDKTQCDLAVLFTSGREPHVTIYHMERDDELLAMVIPRLVEFWKCVEEGVAPAAISSDDATWKYKKSIPKSVDATDEIDVALAELKRVREQIKDLEFKESNLEGTIKEFMQTADVLTSCGVVVTTWKSNRDGTKLDLDRLRAEQPDIVRKYSVEKPGARVFKVK